MLNKKRKILIISILILSVAVYIFMPKVNSYFRWGRAAKAFGVTPYQIGLVEVEIVNCVTVPPIPPPVPQCTPTTTLCGFLPPGSMCDSHAYIIGIPSGGMGVDALFLISNITLAGVTQGGQLMAGGMGPATMDSGILAGAGGCAGTGCAFIETGPIERFKNWFANKLSDFIIAGNRDN